MSTKTVKNKKKRIKIIDQFEMVDNKYNKITCSRNKKKLPFGKDSLCICNVVILIYIIDRIILRITYFAYLTIFKVQIG